MHTITMRANAAAVASTSPLHTPAAISVVMMLSEKC